MKLRGNREDLGVAEGRVWAGNDVNTVAIYKILKKKKKQQRVWHL